ncbi:MAG: SGNH/GDSL hydrolase family protein [Cyanobacteriota bacterium]|nr:SGNH/GDSL hydrolase family protein [Cyanobacteriota bacterium]
MIPRVSELLVFGDSLCDGGNARALLGDGAFLCPPHWANRRCDGPLWVEGLAAGLGLPPLAPSLAGGTNHAFGGARSGSGFSPKGVPNLLTQVEGFLERGEGRLAWRPGVGRDGPWLGSLVAGAGAESADPALLLPALEGSSVLVVVRAGANDYLDAPPGPAVGDSVNGHLIAAVNALADLGLRQFLVPSELPWGTSPIELPGIGALERRALNALIARQNAALREALVELAGRRQLVVVQPDFHGLFLEIQAAPEAWGFREIQRPALAHAAAMPSTESAAPDASGFLWWDAWGHLTSAFHRHLAERALGVLRQVR